MSAETTSPLPDQLRTHEGEIVGPADGATLNKIRALSRTERSERACRSGRCHADNECLTDASADSVDAGAE